MVDMARTDGGGEWCDLGSRAVVDGLGPLCKKEEASESDSHLTDV
jgi:hypothetical protein